VVSGQVRNTSKELAEVASKGTEVFFDSLRVLRASVVNAVFVW